MKLQIILLCLFLIGLTAFVFYRKRGKTRSFLDRDFATQTHDVAQDHEDLHDDLRVIVQTTHFIVIRLMAPKDNAYVGYELMQALLSAGLRYGSRNIFHYYEETEGNEKVLFSLASAVEPGTFELSQMGSITCPGLTLFMEYTTHNTTNPLNRLTLMMDTARQLSEDLGGQLLTDKSKPLTEQDIKRWRIQFEAYERNKETRDLLSTA